MEGNRRRVERYYLSDENLVWWKMASGSEERVGGGGGGSLGPSGSLAIIVFLLMETGRRRKILSQNLFYYWFCFSSAILPRQSHALPTTYKDPAISIAEVRLRKRLARAASRMKLQGRAASPSLRRSRGAKTTLTTLVAPQQP